MYRRLNYLLMASCLVLLSATGALAVDCDDDVNNEIVNCGFDSDTSSWSLSFGTNLSHSVVDGSPDLGTARITGAPGGLLIVSNCNDTPHVGDATLRAGRFKHVSGTAPTFCHIQTYSCPAANCGGTCVQSVGPSIVPDGTWKIASTSAVFPPGDDQSSYIRAFCDGDGTTVVDFDNAVFGFGAQLPVQLQLMTVE
jgi:hypothetical protein